MDSFKNERHNNSMKKMKGILTSLVIFLVAFLAGDYLITNHLFVERYAGSLHISSHPIYHHDLHKNVGLSIERWGTRITPIFSNSLGFRDSAPREVELSTNGKRRLLFIGDSFTFGSAVKWENTFIDLVGKGLGDSFEVLNAGVTSYSTMIYYHKIKYLIEVVGLKFDDLFVMIDISDNQDDSEIYYYNQDGGISSNSDTKIPYGIPPFIYNIAKKTAKSLHFTYQLFRVLAVGDITPKNLIHPKKKILKNTYNGRRASWTYDKKIFQEYGEKGLNIQEKYMNALLTLLKKHNIKLHLGVYPWPDQLLHDKVDSIQVSHWSDWSIKNNIDFYNFFPSFFSKIQEKNIQEISKFFIEGDVHWNEGGHGLIAKEIIQNWHQKNK
jgi:hypothetical protein